MTKQEKRDYIYRAFPCMGCKENTHYIDEYYMVTKKVWTKAVPEIKGMLCIGCLEKRIKRKLTYKDFKNVPLNHMGGGFGQSKRLIDRLGISNPMSPFHITIEQMISGLLVIE